MAEVRVQNNRLESHQHIQVALRNAVYGIGKARARKICDKVGISYHTRVRELSEGHIRQIQDAVKEYETEGDLRRKIASNIKRLKDIKCYRGRRHMKGLPCRGQRTKTNARTRKGPAGKTVGKKGDKGDKGKK